MKRELPASFYKRRQVISDRLAACVFIAPNRCPTRSQLPREIISDPNLVRVLALATIAFSADSMAKWVLRDLGPRYLSKLINLLMLDGSDCAFVWNVDFYAAQLVAMHSQELQHLEILRSLQENQFSASVEIYPPKTR